MSIESERKSLCLVDEISALSAAGEKKYLYQRLLFCPFFRDAQLKLEYSDVSVRLRSQPVILANCIFAVFAFVFALITLLVREREERPLYYALCVLDVCACVCNLCGVVLCWLVLYRQTHAFYRRLSLRCVFSHWLREHTPQIQVALLLFQVAGDSCRFLSRILSGPCETADFLSHWTCNEYAQPDQTNAHIVAHTHAQGLPMDTLITMLMRPIFFSAVIRESRMDIVLFAFCVVVAVVCVGIWLTSSFVAFFYVIPYALIASCVVHDSILQNIHSFITTKELSDALKENKRMNAHIEKEMRNILGNVAHDFKTPLSSFMAGIEVISFSLDDFERKLSSLAPTGRSTHEDGSSAHTNSPAHDEKEPDQTSSSLIHRVANTDSAEQSLLHTHDLTKKAICSIRSVLHDVRSTNAFMLMTINRCLDFAKVKQGLRLAPKNETIHLLDTLRTPLLCVRNIQARVAVEVKEIDSDLCAYIITDKQWLQENVLCLLSNAVKYSNEGTVTLSVKLKRDFSPPQIHAQEVLSTTHAHPNHTTRSIDTASPTSIHTLHKDKIRRERYLHANSRSNSETEMTYSAAKIFRFHRNAHTQMSRSSSFTASAAANDEEATNLDEEGGVNHLNDGLKTSSSWFSLSGYNNKTEANAQQQNQQQYRDCVLVEVEDEGIGLSPEELSSLFVPFKQAQRLAGGTGLGLFSLAKRVEAMHGFYGASARSDGKRGARFWFAFPYRPDYSMVSDSTIDTNRDIADFVSPPKPTNGDACTDAEQKTIKDAIPPPLSLTDRSPSVSRSSSSLSVLLVEDSPMIAKMVRQVLQKHTHLVTVAENGAVALQRLSECISFGGFDVVLMDLQMPVMDGLEATRRLRQREKEEEKGEGAQHQRIIGLSANSDEETVKAALQVGMDAFLQKPFSIESFNTTMETISRKQGNGRN